MVIPNKYKDILNEFINSSDMAKFLDKPKSSNKKLDNTFKPEDKSIKIRLKLEKKFYIIIFQIYYCSKHIYS